MFAKRLLEKVTNLSSPPPASQNAKVGSVAQADLDPRITLHHGIPSTASTLAFDPIQRLMAIGTQDGRIKVIDQHNIEGLLISPKPLPYKNLEFLYNKGFLVSISNENEIQVWDLEHRCMACFLQWDSNITAFSALHGTYFMYVGDEWGLVSVLKYNVEDRKLLQLPYHIPSYSLADAAGVSITNQQSIVGLLPQTSTCQSRLLIAYENGLIVLWDVSEAQVVLVRGYKDLQLRDVMVVGSTKGLNNETPDDIGDQEQEDKEISSLCWASSDESILAVGYVDGDIMLWNISCASSSKGQQSGTSSNNVLKLQLSSSVRRLPVIVLHWSPSSRLENASGGQLFIYGGDEIGSEEVLTVLCLEWSSGMETLRCVNRVDLKLHGSFSDLILAPSAWGINNTGGTLFVLTNAGQLHVYEDSILSGLSSQLEEKPSVCGNQFPVLVPTVDPCMTVTKLSLVPMGGYSSKTLVEVASIMKVGATPLSTGSKLPFTGSVSSQSMSPKNNEFERLYMAGYQDGSVRIWDATRPVFSLMFILEGEVENGKVSDAGASISALDFCPLTLSLAVGNECGLVRVYKLSGNSGETELYFVFETKHEVKRIHQGKGFQSRAVFSILSSPIQTLQYVNDGAKLAVGYGCGRVGMLDMSSLSVLFVTESLSGSSTPVISLTEKSFLDTDNLIDSMKDPESMNPKDPADVLLVLIRDSHMVILDIATGNKIRSKLVEKNDSTAISMHIIDSRILLSEASKERHAEKLSQNTPTQDEPAGANNFREDSSENTLHTSSENTTSGVTSSDLLVLICCEDALCLFSLHSMLKGDHNSICKANLAKPCCWTTTFKSKDDKASGLVLLYQTGVIEIRSFPDLEVVREISLASILRWSFKDNMNKRICSLESGQISLVNGLELAFISLLACENDWRIPESLPSLHDKILAAAADAAFNVSANQKKKQDTSPGILDGIIKGIKGEKLKSEVDLTESLPTLHLEKIFSKAPFPDPAEALQEILDLNIDDIIIDEPIHVTPIASHQGKIDKKGKETERDKLFQGSTADIKPRLRNPDEIKAKYRKDGDASAAAAQAREKLVERQEKLAMLSERTAELQNGSENFASMASELAKTMEAKKWWKL